MEGGHLASATFVRVVWITLLISMLVWICKYLDGFAFGPTDEKNGANNTVPLFNWHPLLMILAFPVLMTEGLLTHTAFPLIYLPRFWRKVVHGTIQSIALVMIALALVAVFRSHSEKKPDPYDDLYSAHSYMGITTVTAFTLQYIGGNLLFVFQVLSEEQKKLIIPYHHFFGMVSYLSGLATILMGIQERAAFAGNGKNYEPVDKLIAVMCLLVFLLAAAVGFHNMFQRAPEKSTETPAEEQEQLTSHMITTT